MSRRILAVAAAAALVWTGCPKAGETTEAQEPEPAAGEAQGPGARPSSPTSDDTLSEALFAAGVAPPQAASPHGDHGPAAPAEPERPALERVIIQADVGSLLATPVWPMLQQLLREEGDAPDACLFELLPFVERFFWAARIGPDGDWSDSVVSVHVAATTDQVKTCLDSAVAEGTELREIPMAGTTALSASDDPPEAEVIAAEPQPGWWLVGTRREVEALLTTGGTPEEDPEFAELTAPLGPYAVRIALTTGPGFLEAAPPPDPHTPAGCLADAWRGMTGFGVGAGWTTGLDVAFAVRHHTAAEASETQACFDLLWQALETALRQWFAGSSDPRAQAVPFGLVEQALGSVRIEAPGNFTILRASAPLQLIMALMLALG